MAPNQENNMTKPYLTSLDSEGWMIDDGEVAHAESPESFWIPPLEERASLYPGDLAKIRFYIRVEDEAGVIEDCGERMWVEIVGKIDDWYRGLLDNQPHCTDAINPGFEVWFEPRHVVDIMRSESN